MLRKRARLNVSENFKWVMSGDRRETSRMKLFYKNGENTLALVGVAVSSKDFKKAYLRVEAKRLVYRAVEKIYGDLPAALNLVIMPKSSIIDSSIDELVAELRNGKFSS